MIRFYNPKLNVLDAAKQRINFVFDEFETVIIGVSGGKDSTVVYNLALEIARERNRLPLKVFFLDQEAEWEATIDIIKVMMYNPEVEPIWLQVPFRLFNSASATEPWGHCWKEGDEWIRHKDPISIKENIYGQDRFHDMFPAYLETVYPDNKVAYIAGVRCEESPSRTLGLTSNACYKHVTWGKRLQRDKHITFYPLYDWSYTDVWKAIHTNKWQYNKVYDYMYQYGISINNMRVSNLHSETSVHALHFLQEVEPENYNKVAARISGVDTVGKLGSKTFYVKDLPYMFKDWKEYRDFLLEKLIPEESQRKVYRAKFIETDKRYAEIKDINKLHQQHVTAILANDFHFTKLGNWERKPEVNCFRLFKKGKKVTMWEFIKDEDRLIYEQNTRTSTNV